MFSQEAASRRGATTAGRPCAGTISSKFDFFKLKNTITRFAVCIILIYSAESQLANKKACSLTGNLRFIFNTILIITGEKIQDGITREYKLYATTRGHDERQ